MAKLNIVIIKPQIDANEDFLLHLAKVEMNDKKLEFPIKELKKCDEFLGSIGAKYLIPKELDACAARDLYFARLWEFYNPIELYPKDLQIFIDGEEINSEQNFFSYFKNKEHTLINNFKFKEAYLIAEEMERFTVDLAQRLLGKNCKIEEINGSKYVYNPEEYDMENDNNFVYNVYEIGQKIDRKGRIRVDRLIYPYGDNKGSLIQEGTEYENLYTEYFYTYSEAPAKITKPGILEPLNIRFMKDVIRLQGSYTILATAAKGVQDAVGDDSDSYIVKLFNGALNTREYKEAYNKDLLPTMQDKSNILKK